MLGCSLVCSADALALGVLAATWVLAAALVGEDLSDWGEVLASALGVVVAGVVLVGAGLEAGALLGETAGLGEVVGLALVSVLAAA